MNSKNITNIEFPPLKKCNRDNFPYCVEISPKDKEAYFIDRNYIYMGFFTKSFSDIKKNNNANFERHYIYDDSSIPWKPKGKRGPPCKKTQEDYLKAINKILDLCKGKKIMWYNYNCIDKRNEYINLKNILFSEPHLLKSSLKKKQKKK